MLGINRKFQFFAMLLLTIHCDLFAQSSLLELSSSRYEIRKSNQTSVQKSRRPASEVPTEIQQPVQEENQDPEAKAKGQVQTKAIQVLDSSIQRSELKQPDLKRAEELKQPRLEFMFGSLLISQASDSNFSARKYDSLLQALQLQGRFWVSEQFALEGQIVSSFNGNMTDSSVNQTQTPLNFEEMKLSFLSQNSFDGADRVRFYASYLDTKYKVSSKATAKLGSQSTGLGVGIKLLLARTEKYHWVFSTDLYPRLSHQENSGLAGAYSGSAPQSSRVDLSVGGEYLLTARAVVTWGIDYNYTKNLFEGSASIADPLTSVTPQNVSVDQSSLIFRLGYRWGR